MDSLTQPNLIKTVAVFDKILLNSVVCVFFVFLALLLVFILGYCVEALPNQN